MIVSCEKCHALYDDETRWTICPHRLLEANPVGPRGTNVGYCSEHDLFNCNFPHQKEEHTHG